MPRASLDGSLYYITSEMVCARKDRQAKLARGGYKHQLLPGCQTNLRIWVKGSTEEKRRGERGENTCALKLHAKRKAKVESKLSYSCASKSMSLNVAGDKSVAKVVRGDACPRN